MNPIRSILGHMRRPDIAFHISGRIDISSRVARALSISPGDCIDILTDGTDIWLYVRIRASDAKGRCEARCLATKGNSRNLRAFSRRLCAYILDPHPGAASVRLAAGEPEQVRGHTAIPIISRRPLTVNT